MWTFIISMGVVALLAWAYIASYRSNNKGRKGGGCNGSCAGCSGCSAPSEDKR